MPVSPQNPNEEKTPAHNEETVLYTATEVEQIVQGRRAGLLQELTDLKQPDSERKQTEDALRESEEKYRTLVEQSLQSLLIIQDSRIVFANRWAVEFGGYSERELLAMSPEEILRLFHPEDRCMVARRMRERLAGMDVPSRYEVRFVRRDGKILWGDVFVSLVRYQGRVAHQITFVDITDRKRMEDALKQSEEKYRNLVELAPDAILIHREGRISYVNPEGMRLLGVSRPDELVGQEIMSIVPLPYRDQIQSNIREDLERGASTPIELPILRLDGSLVWVDGRGTRTYFEDKPAVQVFLRDISERKRAERELEVYAENLKQSNEDLQRFAYVSSHDLKEPLRAIVSFSQILEQEYRGRLDERGDRYIRNIVEAGSRMNALIDDLLRYSHLAMQEVGQKETASQVVLDKALTLLGPQIESAGAAITHDPLPPVRMDDSQLMIVFQNLISNAIKFRKPEVPPEVHVTAQKQDGMVQFSVADNGIGIEPQYREKIFVIFERLHGRNEYPGTGIGLAIVKRIIERHGGEIWVDSEQEEGSTFHFTIPAVKCNQPR